MVSIRESDKCVITEEKIDSPLALSLFFPQVVDHGLLCRGKNETVGCIII